MGMINRVMALGIGLLVLAIVMPIALSAIANASTVNWNANVITVFQTLLPIIAVIGGALYFLPRVKGG